MRQHGGHAAGGQDAAPGRGRHAAGVKATPLRDRWTRPAAPARSCWARTSSCWTGTWTSTWRWSRSKWADGHATRGSTRHRRGEWRLTTGERKRILLDHIYGVDIDPQAVEVTKLSLLLKVLEGESEQTLASSSRLFHERALPDLGRNIKCGNSLIGPDFYDGQQMALLDDEERYRDQRLRLGTAEFPEVVSGGARAGFDAVIGNPPYIRIQTLKEWAPLEVEYYKQRYAAAGKGNYDIYVVFVEKGLSLLNERGRLGFILPHKFFNAQYGEPLRRLLAEGRHLAEVVHFGDQQVFARRDDLHLPAVPGQGRPRRVPL